LITFHHHFKQSEEEKLLRGTRIQCKDAQLASLSGSHSLCMIFAI
jgi:hypothetical protein